MVSACAQLVIVMVVLGNIVVQGCYLKQSKENGKNCEIFDEYRDNETSLESIHKEALLQTDRTGRSNKNTDHLREVARKKSSKDESMMNGILPMLIIPFLISSSLIPAMLLSIKFLMIKSAIIGKIAVTLMILSFFRRREDSGGVYNHYPMDVAKEHYGYQGVAEPGAYINKKKRRRRDLE